VRERVLRILFRGVHIDPQGDMEQELISKKKICLLFSVVPQDFFRLSSSLSLITYYGADGCGRRNAQIVSG
jgi:hypothetical protein